MKRFLLLLLTLSLLPTAVLAGCSPKSDPPNEDNDSPAPESDTRYSVIEPYLPKEVSAQMGTLFEGGDKAFVAPQVENLPFMIMDELIISQCTVKSITIPVWKTGKADSIGNYYFTLSVVNGDLNGIKRTLADPIKTYRISVNSSIYDLHDNLDPIRKWIKIPLEQYDIKLTQNQTLAFGAPTDTLFAAVLKTETGTGQSKTPAVQHFLDNWGVVRYYYLNAASNDALSISHEALVFDFELIRTYNDQATYDALVAAETQAESEYQAKVAAVKAAYQGKSLSVLGDSISTFGTVSNTLAHNPDYNPSEFRPYVNSGHQAPGGNSYKKEMMYWGKLAEDASMELNVISAWSGSRVYGGNADTNQVIDMNTCNMLHRSSKLASGNTPDLILIYFGVNDFYDSPSSCNPKSNMRPNVTTDPTGNLYQRLTEKGAKASNEIVGEWFAEVLEKAKAAGYDPEAKTPTVLPGTTYTTWEAAYALSLHYMLSNYDSPEIYIINLIGNNYWSQDPDSANIILQAFAEYFNVGLIDQANGYREKATCHLFTYDAGGLHPNYKGHMLLTRLIIETLYNDLEK